jgi:hydroxymethylbilane synthase
MVLRIGTRASRLARAQAAWVAERLASAFGPDVELVDIVSEGDRSSRPLTEIGGTGVFVNAVRDAVVSGRVDIAVHSLKDLPTTPDPRLSLAAIPVREDPRDALVASHGRTLAELPAAARVGTGSPRRAAQLAALGLGLDVVPIRGNVETRIGKVTSGDLDAVVLAHAGLIRAGLRDRVTEVLDPLQMLPAPGQGALAVEVAAAAEGLRRELADVLDDGNTRAAVVAERALLRALEAGCSAPVGALADVAEGDDGQEIWLRGVVASPHGAAVRLSATGPVATADRLGRRLAEQMLAEGAGELMKEPVT